MTGQAGNLELFGGLGRIAVDGVSVEGQAEDFFLVFIGVADNPNGVGCV